MKSIIDKFIAEIQIDRNFNFNTAEYDYNLKFCGDGFGDFEESSLTTTKDCITNYVKEKEAQVYLAKKVMLD